MADINSPREFLTELLGLTDQLEADRTALIECGERKKSLENAFASMKNSIEKEKNKTISDRRSDIETGFDKQLKALSRRQMHSKMLLRHMQAPTSFRRYLKAVFITGSSVRAYSDIWFTLPYSCS